MSNPFSTSGEDASADDVTKFHNKDDLDADVKSHHHTIGPGPTQAASNKSVLQVQLNLNFANFFGNLRWEEEIKRTMGVAVAYMGSAASIDAKFLPLEGQSLLRSAYPDLFARIGTTWGAVDGTHFNLPDLRDRSIVGVSGTKAVGTTGGAATVTLVANDLPVHTHALGGSTGNDSPDHVHDIGHNHTGNSRTGIGANASAFVRSDATAIGVFTGVVNAFAGNSLGRSTTHTHTLPANTGNNTTTGTAVGIQDPYGALIWITRALL